MVQAQGDPDQRTPNYVHDFYTEVTRLKQDADHSINTVHDYDSYGRRTSTTGASTGTINSITYDSNSNSLDYGYNAYKGGTASVGSTNLPDPGLQALQRGALLADPGVNIPAAGTAIVMSGALAGATYGAWAGGTALTTLSIPAATLPPLVSNPTLQGIVNKLFQATDRLPGGTAGAVRYELATGDLMSPSGHSGKAQELIVALTNLLKSGKLMFNDQIVSRQIIQELSDALKTQPRR